MSHHHKDRVPGGRSLNLNRPRKPRGLALELILALGLMLCLAGVAAILQAMWQLPAIYTAQELVYLGRPAHAQK
jgi:hypothetical protein